MADIDDFIQSGILEGYCMDLLSIDERAYVLGMCLLHPEVKDELDNIETTLEKLAAAASVEPADHIKGKILAALGFDDKSQLPLTSKTADVDYWLDIMSDLIPADPTEDFILHELTVTEQVHQMLVITKSNVPDETHGDFIESFFILKGHCECTVGDDTVKLGRGDFLEVPLHVHHDIRITSPHVVAILQRQFI